MAVQTCLEALIQYLTQLTSGIHPPECKSQSCGLTHWQSGGGFLASMLPCYASPESYETWTVLTLILFFKAVLIPMAWWGGAGRRHRAALFVLKLCTACYPEVASY